MKQTAVIKGTNYEIQCDGTLINLKTCNVIKWSKDTNGYMRAGLWHDGKCKTVAQHRLLAEYFIDNPECKLQVNHKNGIKTDNRIENLELLQNKLYLVTGKNSHYPKKKYDVSILEELPIIYREKGSGTRYTMERYFESKGILLRKQMELTSNEAVKQAIIAGLGSSIMPLIGLKNEIYTGDLKIIPVKGLPIKSFWQLIWQKNKGFSPVASAFLQHLREEKDRIIQQDFNWYEAYE